VVRGEAARSGRPASGLFHLGFDADSDELTGAHAVITASAPCGEPEGSAVLSPSEMPDELVVPVFPVKVDEFSRLEWRLVRSADDLLAVGFTSPERLVEALGEYQPWLRLPTATLNAVVGTAEVAGLVVDPDVDLMSAVWTRRALLSLEEVHDVRL